MFRRRVTFLFFVAAAYVSGGDGFGGVSTLGSGAGCGVDGGFSTLGSAAGSCFSD